MADEKQKSFQVKKTKVCTKCKIEKEIEGFVKSKDLKDGLSPLCKMCRKKTHKIWLSLNHDKAIEATREWHKKNKDRSIEVNRIWRTKNVVKKREQVKKWGLAHPEKNKEYSRRGSAKRRSTIKGKINDAFSSAMYRSLKELKGGRHWEELVGYTIDQLKDHIEKQFKEGMSWENYGKFTWHIDHIIPVAAFNFDSPECQSFKECWDLSNLQPLEAKKNHSKKDRIILLS